MGSLSEKEKADGSSREASGKMRIGASLWGPDTTGRSEAHGASNVAFPVSPGKEPRDIAGGDEGADSVDIRGCEVGRRETDAAVGIDRASMPGEVGEVGE